MEIDRLRDVALHAIASLSTRPEGLQLMDRPWEFLLKKTDSPFLDWGNEPLNLCAKALETMKQGNVNQVPFMITAYSGAGKSLFMSQLAANILQSVHDYNENGSDGRDEPEFPRFDLAFSQLKGQGAEPQSLEEAICIGLDSTLACNGFDTLERRWDEIGSKHRRCLIIDSLDELEHKYAGEWWQVSTTMMQKGWVVVWSCRRTDFSSRLKEKIPSEYREAFNKLNTDWSWDVQLNLENKVRIKSSISGLDSRFEELGEKKNIAEQFLESAHKSTPLLQIFSTNFLLDDETRKKANEKLGERLAHRVITFVEGIDQHYENSGAMCSATYFEYFYKIHPVYILLETTQDLLVDSRMGGGSQWEALCKSTNYSNETVNIEAIDEEFIEDLIDYGLLIQTGRNQHKWRHRDFAMHAYIQGAGGLRSFLESPPSDDMFGHLRLHEFFDEMWAWKSTSNSDERKKHEQYVIDFDRRTASAFKHVKPMADEAQTNNELVDFLHGIDDGFETLLYSEHEINDEEVSKLSETQVKSVQDQQGHTLILRGFPGTGKTFTGTRRLLHRHAVRYRQGQPVRSLIVAFNDYLAKSIRTELVKEKYAELDPLPNEARKEILDNIDVLSMKQVYEQWTPDLIPKNNDAWLLQAEQIHAWYDEWRQTAGDGLTYTAALDEVQIHLFDSRTGEPHMDLTEDEQNKHDEERQRLILLWRRFVVDRLKVQSMMAEEQIAAQARERLIAYEAANNARTNHLAPHEEEAIRKVIDKKNFAKLMKKFAETNYDMIMIDEVQDVNPLSTHFLSYLAPHRGENADRFILAGDENQTINGRDFVWFRFLRRLSDLTEIAVKTAKQYGHHIATDDETSRPRGHHLYGLHWKKTNADMKEIKGDVLLKNYRNHEEILNFATLAWRKWPDEDEIVRLQQDDDAVVTADGDPGMMEPVNRTGSKSTEEPLLFLQTDSVETFVDGVKFLIEKIQEIPNTSLLVMSKPMEELIIRLMDGIEEEVEVFNVWNIKGLERENVVLLGSYFVADSDPDIDRIQLNAQNKFKSYDELGSEHRSEIRKQFRLLRRKHLVAHTRAKVRMICLYPPRERISPLLKGIEKYSQYTHASSNKIREKYEHDVGSRAEIEERWGHVFDSVTTMISELYSLQTFDEGIDLYSKYADYLEEENLRRYQSRWKKQLELDRLRSEEKKGNSFLLKWMSRRLNFNKPEKIKPDSIALRHLMNPPRRMSRDDDESAVSLTIHDMYTEVQQHLRGLSQTMWSEDSFELFKRLAGRISDMKTRVENTDANQLATMLTDELRKKSDTGQNQRFDELEERAEPLFASLDRQLLMLLDAVEKMFGGLPVVEFMSLEDYVRYVLAQRSRFADGYMKRASGKHGMGHLRLDQMGDDNIPSLVRDVWKTLDAADFQIPPGTTQPQLVISQDNAHRPACLETMTAFLQRHADEAVFESGRFESVLPTFNQFVCHSLRKACGSNKEYLEQLAGNEDFRAYLTELLRLVLNIHNRHDNFSSKDSAQKNVNDNQLALWRVWEKEGLLDVLEAIILNPTMRLGDDPEWMRCELTRMWIKLHAQYTKPELLAEINASFVAKATEVEGLSENWRELAQSYLFPAIKNSKSAPAMLKWCREHFRKVLVPTRAGELQWNTGRLREGLMPTLNTRQKMNNLLQDEAKNRVEKIPMLALRMNVVRYLDDRINLDRPKFSHDFLKFYAETMVALRGLQQYQSMLDYPWNIDRLDMGKSWKDGFWKHAPEGWDQFMIEVGELLDGMLWQKSDPITHEYLVTVVGLSLLLKHIPRPKEGKEVTKIDSEKFELAGVVDDERLPETARAGMRLDPSKSIQLTEDLEDKKRKEVRSFLLKKHPLLSILGLLGEKNHINIDEGTWAGTKESTSASIQSISDNREVLEALQVILTPSVERTDLTDEQYDEQKRKTRATCVDLHSEVAFHLGDYVFQSGLQRGFSLYEMHNLLSFEAEDELKISADDKQIILFEDPFNTSHIKTKTELLISDLLSTVEAIGTEIITVEALIIKYLELKAYNADTIKIYLTPSERGNALHATQSSSGKWILSLGWKNSDFARYLTYQFAIYEAKYTHDWLAERFRMLLDASERKEA